MYRAADTYSSVGQARAASFNKRFKSDPQRLAFFIPPLGFVFTVVWLRFGGSVAYTLMRRFIIASLHFTLFSLKTTIY